MWAVPAVSCILLGSPVDTVCTDQLLGVPWAQPAEKGLWVCSHWWREEELWKNGQRAERADVRLACNW